jgi:ribonuclease HI
VTLIRWLQRWVGGRDASRVSVYSDGSAEPRSGRAGGWAFVVVQDGLELSSGSGGAPAATNNEMELAAALGGMRCVLERGDYRGGLVELVSDSQLVLEIAGGAVDAKRYGPLAEALRAACAQTHVRTRWVRGHSGERWNERADALATAAREAQLPAKVRRKRQARSSKQPRP